MAEIKLLSLRSKLASKHVIFIHGLGGTTDKTWLSNNAKKETWPLWLLEDNDDINIWSIGYSAPKFKLLNEGMGVVDLATNIFERLLITKKLGEGEIIFICHSLGGLIVKQILRIANEQTKRSITQEFIGRVSGVAFLATPHLGSDIASLGNRLIPSLLMRGLTALKPSVATASLSRNDPNLRALNSWYRDWAYHSCIRHLILIETENLYGIVKVVKPDSADPGLLDSVVIPMQADHETICKPVDKNDDIYLHIKGFITQKKREHFEIWLTSKFGTDVNSWQGYDNWAKCPSGILEEYLVDDKVRLIDSTSQNNEGLSGIDGINTLREKLHKSNSSIRLVGLSGVGKTRFAQALFDTRIGINPIPSISTFYTDIANGPSPTPRVLAEKLVSEGKGALLIVDNCPPELHRTLTSICTSKASKVNLLTIEYDIREDQPETTEVFSLEPSSINLIEKILNARYLNLGQQNARSISEFSGGNSRIAIALAEMTEKDENISTLKDEELFKRLFYQRHNKEKSLEKVAQILSLIYSFQISSEKVYSDELKFLSHLSEVSPKEIYEGAIELKRRSLIQQRSIWMAVLPHPIANKLAKYALENISPAIILTNFNEATDERLIKSFSRRLGYLSQCNEAKYIIKNWFSEDGLLEQLHSNNRNELAWILIGNIAPVSEEEVLLHIEKLTNQTEFLTRNNEQFVNITSLIRSLAYEKKYFDQCAKLLSQFAVSEKKSENNNRIRDILKSLFQLYLSGTHATKEQRLEIIDSLINTKIKNNETLALDLLDSSLKASDFSSSHSFDFGANSRDYGYSPKTNQDINDWYTLFINYTAQLITSGSSNSILAKEKLAKNLCDLWRQRNLRDLIEDTCFMIGKSGMWRDGFSAIHDILRFDCKDLNEAEIERLKSIADHLSPKSLIDDVRMYVLTDESVFDELNEEDDTGKLIKAGSTKVQEYSKELGFKLMSFDNKQLKPLLTELLSYNGTSSNLFAFGEGSVQGAQSNENLLAITIATLEKLQEKERNLDLLCGQINYLSKHNIKLTNAFLDSLIIHPTLKQHFIRVQLSYTIDPEAIVRIIRDLKENTPPIRMYKNLGFVRRYELIPDDKLCEILDLIWYKDHGQEVVIYLLYMRFSGSRQNQDYIVSNFLKEKSASWLALFDYSKERNHFNSKDSHFSKIAKVCFLNNANKDDAISIFTNIKKNILKTFIGRNVLPNFLSTMIQMYPILAFEVFIGDGVEVKPQLKNALTGKLEKIASPFSNLEIQNTLEWCNKSKEERYPKLASIITPYETIQMIETGEKSIKWTPLAIELLENSPDPIKVLDAYLSDLSPTSWMGFKALILHSKSPLFEALISHSNSEVANWAIENKVKWEKSIKSAHKWESERDMDRDERFEW